MIELPAGAVVGVGWVRGVGGIGGYGWFGLVFYHLHLGYHIGTAAKHFGRLGHVPQ